MGHQIVRLETAFSLDQRSRQRSPRQKKSAHLAWIRRLPSVIDEGFPVEAAHLRFANPLYAKTRTGLQEKPNDCWVLPLTPEQHREQHTRNEADWWLEQGIDPFVIAAFLWAHSGNDDAGYKIIRNARQISQRSLTSPRHSEERNPS